MWGEWIAGAEAENPNEDFFAAWFSDGAGFFSFGAEAERPLGSWGCAPDATPIVGGMSFLGRAWGAWREAEFFSPKLFVYFDGEREEVVSRSASFSPRRVEKSLTLTYRSAELRPEWASWEEFCKKIELGLQEESWAKIVPARSIRYARARAGVIDMAALWNRLASESPADTNRFLWKRGGEVFLGASPELLFSLRGTVLRSYAIAGTTKAEGVAELYSNKNAREQSLVVADIESRLRKISDSIEVGTREEISFGILRHLRTVLTARVAGSAGHALAEKALEVLHPTSAVGGVPGATAIKFLAEHEPWQRGYFAAPIGFSYNGSAKFLVAIRSARLTENCAEVFAGAGYVPGSTAEGEWNETRLKMHAMERVLGLGSGL